MKTLSIIRATVMSSILLSASLSMAQESPVPSRSVESFKSWTVECTNITLKKKKADEGEEKKEEKPETNSICETIQKYFNSNSDKEFVRLAFWYEGDKGKRKLTAGFRTLVDISLEKNPEIYVDKTLLVEGKMTRCKGKFCFGHFEVKEDMIEKISKAKESTLRFQFASKRVVTVKLTLDGFTDAMTALKVKEDK